MRLFVAEKPSLARAIAAVLPGPQHRRDGFIQCGAADVVTWCAGHILEAAPPDAYDPAYKQWRVAHLPIAPREWKLSVSAPDLLKTIKNLLPRATRVVHAGDPDREGQLLVDEVLEFLGYRGPVDRVLISDLNPPAVRKALADLRPNTRYRGLYEAALARQRADWLYGINLTRLYTLLGRAGGYDGVLSVGRVQTPLLGLIVRRDLEIERFQLRTYYVCQADVRTSGGMFRALWQPGDTTAGVIDEAGRLVSRERADALRGTVSGRPGTVAAYSRDKKTDAPPLTYSLPDLQIDAGRRLGLSPKSTLEACQALYETHRLITYPRSDCPYLPEGHFGQATGVLTAMGRNFPELLPLIGAADPARRSRAWNDKKVSAHHAIIPTGVVKYAAELSATERGIHELVARRYLAQFFPPIQYYETKIDLTAGSERFRAVGRQLVAEGWRAVLGRPPAEDETEKSQHQLAATGGQSLPTLQVGAAVTFGEIVTTEHRTAPPRRFTDATLIQAMTGIARYVSDARIRQILQETDGIGTPATQAQIIETLFQRRFIEKRGRSVVSTPIGRALIQTLPHIATWPDMTALWEAGIRRIADGHMHLDTFLSTVSEQLRDLIVAGRAQGPLHVPQHVTGANSDRHGAPVLRRPRRPSQQGLKANNRGRR
ncbi:MAG: DNA topoisomerase III [Myxococcales bacterium]